ncbi:hypothetical protein BDZ91DRAFT_724985 [Kalaharituber pfeilii]|nr:hypothetical protein BDZ91DRAFT_724985 [Kalaharituber pfeilii]
MPASRFTRHRLYIASISSCTISFTSFATSVNVTFVSRSFSNIPIFLLTFPFTGRQSSSTRVYCASLCQKSESELEPDDELVELDFGLNLLMRVRVRMRLRIEGEEDEDDEEDNIMEESRKPLSQHFNLTLVRCQLPFRFRWLPYPSGSICAWML